jgi:hypothetical protein
MIENRQVSEVCPPGRETAPGFSSHENAMRQGDPDPRQSVALIIIDPVGVASENHQRTKHIGWLIVIY